MTNGQKAWIWRIVALVIAGAGVFLLLGSVDMGIEQATAKSGAKWEKGEYVSPTEIAALMGGHVLTYMAIGGILLGVGLNRALKPAGTTGEARAEHGPVRKSGQRSLQEPSERR
ncbi:hypothetical protein [Saccharibacillus endophyticus]|uniref:Uncharacterized protein n=1 Tax=Saccharibacillus endophyticus TaxID=2060666 RepID=A0ABQ1ZVR0_9BACL|nr:hypothetical protein [Saccharibacillus endophyticus]GGH79826.1 hypothetical protein GCM10007362_27210 [Saccharibacillus endophyticus]